MAVARRMRERDVIGVPCLGNRHRLNMEIWWESNYRYHCDWWLVWSGDVRSRDQFPARF